MTASPEPRQPAAPARSSAPGVGLTTKLVWVATLYFASGFPYGFLNELLPIYLRQSGASLVTIGNLALVGLPWTFKFLWAPLVDRIGARRQWIISTQLLIAVSIAALLGGDTAMRPELWLLLVAMATLSATQDIATDAYTIELLDDRERGTANGVRVTAYRVAMIVAGGLLVALAGRTGWRSVFLIAAGVMVIAAAVTLTVPSTRRVGTSHEPIWEPIRSLLARPGIITALVFILLYKLGEFTMLQMIRPFWADHFSAEEIGLVQGAIGTGATIAGAIVGGWLTSRLGLIRSLWVLGGSQLLANLNYIAAAATDAARPVVYSASLVEHFTVGLSTAALLTFLMSLSERRFAATQYALLSALFGLSRSLAGSFSGHLAERLGYLHFFMVTLVFALPAFFFLPFIRPTVFAKTE